jgi:hypothetical protein
MKTTIILAALALLCLNTRAADKVPPVAEAIAKAEQKAVESVLQGKLTEARGWTEVAMQLRMGQYAAPFGDITAEFAGQIKNARAFITAAVEVSSLAPVQDWYHGRFKTAAMAALFLQNDPAAFNAWIAVRNAGRDTFHTSGKGRPELTPADYQALYVWVDRGCAGDLSTEAAKQVASLPEVQAAIAPYRPALNTQKVASH